MEWRHIIVNLWSLSVATGNWFASKHFHSEYHYTKNINHNFHNIHRTVVLTTPSSSHLRLRTRRKSTWNVELLMQIYIRYPKWCFTLSECDGLHGASLQQVLRVWENSFGRIWRVIYMAGLSLFEAAANMCDLWIVPLFLCRIGWPQLQPNSGLGWFDMMAS